MIDSNRVTTQTRRWRRSSRQVQSTAVCVACQRQSHQGGGWRSSAGCDYRLCLRLADAVWNTHAGKASH